MAYLSQVKLGNSTYDISAIKLKNARTIQTNLASVSSASFNGTANITPGVTGILAIANGGTNANSAKQARVNLLSIGSNPITTVEDDTVANWGSYGPCATAFYSATGQLTDQPAQWGFVHNIMTTTGTEVHQLWTTQAGGDIYHRGGNASGWATSWKKLLDSSNFNLYSPTLTGTGATGTWGINISGNAATSSSCSGNAATSSSCSGNAATATKLTSSGGSSLIPVYFSSGKPVACTTIYSGKYFGGLTSVGSDGVMEIGKYVDFHNSNADTSDYSTRLMCTGTTGNVISLPTATGTMALTSDLAGYLKLSGGTMNAGKQIARAGSSCSWYGGRDHAMIRQNSYTGYNPIISAKTTDGSWELGPYAGNVLYFVYNTDTGYNSGTNTSGQYFNSVKLNPNGTIYGAVWNDYAEFRICKEDFKPGQVVYENGDDTMSISNNRLQRGCSIISDTFGFAIGETDEAKCPIAVSGRVLAYGYESREEFKKHIGWPVCSGPNGTVSIMTEEEEKYASRIIGTISAVPEYEIWGTGNIEVNNRIWIKIK